LYVTCRQNAPPEIGAPERQPGQADRHEPIEEPNEIIEALGGEAAVG
jgi:hypothetical protein